MIDLLSTLVGAFNGTAAGSALAFFAGLWLGYRLDLNKAKRAEFNTAAASLRDEVNGALDEPGGHRLWRRRSQLCDVVDRMGWLQRRRFLRAWQQYQRDYERGQQADPVGQVLFKGDAGALLPPLQVMRRLLRLR